MTPDWSKLDDIREALDRFVCGNEYPKAMFLSGDWGTGKTHIWLETLERNSKLTKPNYAYVSLFGVNSLDDMKYQLFQVLERRGEKLNDSKPGRWQAITNSKYAKKFDRLSGEEKGVAGKLAFLSKIPVLNQIEPLVRDISFNYVREAIVCIDDFERRGANLRVVDVLGLVSLLREARDSKIILILNEDTLSEADKFQFKQLNEKVFDWGIVLKPSPEHAISCVIPDDDPQLSIWSSNAIALKANNIRIIRRAYEFVKVLRDRYPGASPDIQSQFVNSVLLFCFCKYGKAECFPSLKVVANDGLWGLPSDDEGEEDAEKKLHAEILQAIGWMGADEVDLELIRFVEQGYISQEALDGTIRDLEIRIANHESEQAINKAWNILHFSFKNNADELMIAVFESSKKAVKVASAYSMDQSIKLLRDLGNNEKANELADLFIDENSGVKEKFDLDDYAFANEMRDEYFIGKLRDEFLQLPEVKDLHEVLLRLGKENSWGGSDEVYLDQIDVGEVEAFFVNYEGEDLPRILKGATRFINISNPSDRIERIGKKMKSALQRIAGMSDINAWRLKRFGITPAQNE